MTRKMLRRGDVEYLNTQVLRRMEEGAQALLPRLLELMRRSEEWGPDEEAAWSAETDAMIAKVLEWADAEASRRALPDPSSRLDS